MSTTLTLITHACLLIESDGKKILTDPWLSGSQFNNGWDLMYTPKETIDSIDPDYIWYSHEHPDHFSVRDILACKKKYHILTYKADKPNLANFCRAKGHTVTEIQDGDTFCVGNLALTVGVSRGFDSWLFFQAPDVNILNLNDCRVETAKELLDLKTKVGNIDILLSQFAPASWTGNKNDVPLRAKARKKVLDILRTRLRALRPKAFIPFANFSWFSHEENHYLNNQMPTPYIATRLAQEYCSSEILEPTITRLAVDLLQCKDYCSPSEKLRLPRFWFDSLHKINPVSIDNLHDSYNYYLDNLKLDNDYQSILDIKKKELLPTTVIHLHDLNKTLEFDISRDSLIEIPYSPFDISMASDSLDFLLRNKFGRGTLNINGRFQLDYKNAWKFYRQTQIAYANNIGKSFPETLSEDELTKPNTFCLENLDED